MTVHTLRTLPDPVLRQKAKRVGKIDSSIKKLIADMWDTLHAAPGRVGLAAPQIGVSLRVIIIGIPEEDEVTLINPKLVRKSGERTIDEGCLSVPGYFSQVNRAESVTVKGRDQEDREVRIKASGLLAQALEHEIDHLNGLLYVDLIEDISQLHKVSAEPEE